MRKRYHNKRERGNIDEGHEEYLGRDGGEGREGDLTRSLRVRGERGL